ncbi:MAG TPA: hypothetical protein VJL08_01985, partial [Dehalococcoidia bacterium]|nr:hypothetical protein [Dehalococcoidia bacterium]
MTKVFARLALPLVVALALLFAPAPRTQAVPTPSGAEPAYPLNHTFDADIQSVGTPPPNSGFEAPGYSTGTPPANYDLSAPAQDVGTPPTNYNFETGDFSGWTVSGTASIQSDAPHGYYAKLGASATIISSAFTVDSAAQAFVLDVGYLATSGWNEVKVYALTGPDYATETLLATLRCTSSCVYWKTAYIDASAYLGQSIKLKFARTYGDVGLDAVRGHIPFPSHTVTGTFSRETEAGGNVYARLGYNSSLTSAAFTLAPDAQYATVRIKNLSNASYYIYVLSGPGFGTSTQVTYGTAPSAWQDVRFNVSSWQGQQIKIKVRQPVANSAFALAADDFGLQKVEVPQWDVTADTSIVAGGPNGKYVRTNGQLTSSAFTLPADVQQLSLLYRGGAPSSVFHVYLLRGPGFSEVITLKPNVSADETAWKTLKLGVSLYAGETVKLRLDRGAGTLLFDNVGLGEIVVPGWKLASSDAVATG